MGEPGFEKLRSVAGTSDNETYLSDGPNLYAFVANNPLNKVDALGLVSLPPGWGGLYEFRPYTPSQARFLNRDPIEERKNEGD